MGVKILLEARKESSEGEWGNNGGLSPKRVKQKLCWEIWWTEYILRILKMENRVTGKKDVAGNKATTNNRVEKDQRSALVCTANNLQMHIFTNQSHYPFNWASQKMTTWEGSDQRQGYYRKKKIRECSVGKLYTEGLKQTVWQGNKAGRPAYKEDTGGTNWSHLIEQSRVKRERWTGSS